METSRRAQVLNVAGNQLSGSIPAAWARDLKAAEGSAFPDLRVAALLPSAGRPLAMSVHASLFCSVSSHNDRLCSRASFVRRLWEGEGLACIVAGMHMMQCCG